MLAVSYDELARSWLRMHDALRERGHSLECMEGQIQSDYPHPCTCGFAALTKARDDGLAYVRNRGVQ